MTAPRPRDASFIPHDPSRNPKLDLGWTFPIIHLASPELSPTLLRGMHPPSGSMPSLVLPQELVDRIIDEVAILPADPPPPPTVNLEHWQASETAFPYTRYENRFQEFFDRPVSCVSSPGLLVCAQVSRAFRDRARWYIFEEIKIRLDAKDEECVRARDFVGLMEAEGDGDGDGGGLAGLVRSFRLELCDSEGVGRGRGWMYDDPWTAKLLPRLCKLERVAVEGLRDGSFFYAHRWSDFGEKMRGALWGVHGRESVRMLRVGEIWSVPADWVLRWASVRSLEMVGTSFNSYEDAEHGVHGDGHGKDGFLWLESLDTRGCAALLSALEIVLERAGSDRRRILGSLRRFRVEPPIVQNEVEMRNHMENVWNIAADASHTLEDLDLVRFFIQHPQFEAIPIDLTTIKFPSLRTIRIKESFMVLEDMYDYYSEVLPLICRVLCCLVDASSGSLQRLSVDMSWILNRVGRSDSDYDLLALDPRTWAALDESLARVRGFKELDIAVTIHYPSMADWVESDEQAGLARLREMWTLSGSRQVFPVLLANSSDSVRLQLKKAVRP